MASINTRFVRWDNDAIVFTGTLTTMGMEEPHMHNQVTVVGGSISPLSIQLPGSYYVFDVVNNVGSFRFEIGDNVYE
jgi:hypothetical protein